MNTRPFLTTLTAAFILMVASVPALAQQQGQLPDGVQKLQDIEYANVDGHSLKLDLYMPEVEGNRRPPLLVWIHGGGWRGGGKGSAGPILWLTGEGYAVASISYRLSRVAKFPAQIHDCKGAIRWLRAHAEEYGYDADRIGVAGASAGGHLVTLLGTTGGMDVLEGQTAGHTDQSSRVQAVVNFFGPTDLTTLEEQGHPEFTTSLVALMLDDPISSSEDRAKLASPVFHVTSDDPPLLTLQGTRDRLIYVPQAEALHKVYEEAGLETTLEIIDGAGHGGPPFGDARRRQLIQTFFDKHVRGR